MKMTPESSRLNGFDLWKLTLTEYQEIEFEYCPLKYEHPKSQVRKRVKEIIEEEEEKP